jgi:hypothetical protein
MHTWHDVRGAHLHRGLRQRPVRGELRSGLALSRARVVRLVRARNRAEPTVARPHVRQCKRRHYHAVVHLPTAKGRALRGAFEFRAKGAGIRVQGLRFQSFWFKVYGLGSEFIT